MFVIIYAQLPLFSSSKLFLSHHHQYILCQQWLSILCESFSSLTTQQLYIKLNYVNHTREKRLHFANMVLDNPKLTDTTTGWRLLGVEKNISVDDILNKNQKISIVWAYKDGTWYAKGADESINSLIMQNYNISLLDTLESGDGFWINVK